MSDIKSGIYRIVHVPTQHCYIGSACNIAERWRLHRLHLQAGNHHSKHLQSAWLKYGTESFVFEIVELVANRADLIAREQYYLDQRFSEKGSLEFNSRPIADSQLGFRHSAKTRRLISELQANKPLTARKIAAYERRRQRKDYTDAESAYFDSMRGREPTEHDRQFLASGRAYLASLDTAERSRLIQEGKARAKAARGGMTALGLLRAARARRGIPKSAKTRAKIAAANTGKTQSAETIAKRLETFNEVGFSERMHQHRLNQTDSDATKLKRSQSMQGKNLSSRGKGWSAARRNTIEAFSSKEDGVKAIRQAMSQLHLSFEDHSTIQIVRSIAQSLNISENALRHRIKRYIISGDLP